jgi:hypothetical protein
MLLDIENYLKAIYWFPTNEINEILRFKNVCFAFDALFTANYLKCVTDLQAALNE